MSKKNAAPFFWFPLTVLIFFGLACGVEAAPPTAINQRVQIKTGITNANVRSTAGGPLIIGPQSFPAQGITVGGPTTASLGGMSYTWWNINFDSGADGWVADINLEALAAIPSTPANPTPGTGSSPGPTISGTTVTLNWSSSSGATSYGFAVRDMTTNALVVDSTTASTSYTASNLTAGRTYRWNVAAINSAGRSSYTTPLYFTTSSQVSEPTVSIALPSGNVTIPNSAASYGFSGSAAAPGSTLAAVEWRVGGGNWNNASGTTSWTFTAGNLSVGANLVEVRSRNSQGAYSPTASRMITRESSGQAAPSITGLSPNPVVGSSSQQTITIIGANFAGPPIVTLTWTGQANYQVPANRVTLMSSTEIRISITTGITQDGWTVRVASPNGQISNSFPFQVTSPDGGALAFLGMPLSSGFGGPYSIAVSSLFDHSPKQDGQFIAFNGYTISSSMNVPSGVMSPVNYVGAKGIDGHGGIDFPVPVGTPIYAAAEGYVDRAGGSNAGAEGFYVAIDHASIGKKYRTLYMHLNGQSAILVNNLQHVTKGQLIGYSGATGAGVSGPHLHFQVNKVSTGGANTSVDPYGSNVGDPVLWDSGGTTPMAAGKPFNPVPASGAGNLPRTPHFTWTAGANTSLFRIYLGTTGDLGSGAPNQIQTAQNAFFDPEGLSYGTTYYFRVDAVNAEGAITTGDVWSFSTGSAPVLLAEKPFNPVPASGAGNLPRTPHFTWTAGANTSLFRIYLGTTGDLGSGAPNQIQTAQNAFFDPEGLSYGTTYYFRVDAVNAEGAITAGDVWSFSTAPASYTVTISAGSGGTVSPQTSQTTTSGGNLTFSASPLPSYTVDKWSVDGAVAQTGGNSFTLTSISADHLVTVSFRLLGATIVVNTAGVPLEGGSISGGGSYAVGGAVTLTANPAAGYYFDGWTSGASGLDNPISLNPSADILIQAKFTRVPSRMQLVQARFADWAPDNFIAALVGSPAGSVMIQRSGDLRTWTDWSTVTVPPSGFASFTDTAPLELKGYYRIKPVSGETVASLNFDDNQVPSGWNLSFLSFPRVNGGVSNQRLEAREVDTTAVLTKTMVHPSSSGSISFKWTANIINNEWGMGTGVRIKMSDGSIYTTYAGKQGYKIETGIFQISHDLPQETFLQEYPIIPWGDYKLEATFSQGAIRLKAVEKITHEVVFDRSAAAASFRLDDIAAIEFMVVNTSGPAAWMDDAEIITMP